MRDGTEEGVVAFGPEAKGPVEVDYWELGVEDDAVDVGGLGDVERAGDEVGCGNGGGWRPRAT